MANLAFIGFLQATGLVVYVTSVSLFMSNAQNWFGQKEDTVMAPILMLTLFCASALICGLIALAYPIKLFWVEKKPMNAIKVIGFTVLFLVVFFALIATIIAST